MTTNAKVICMMLMIGGVLFATSVPIAVPIVFAAIVAGIGEVSLALGRLHERRSAISSDDGGQRP